MAKTKNYWLLKSEPDVFSIDHLKACPKKTEPWDGIRNYQARNFMRDEMKKGDMALFYHSNCSEVGVVGTMEIVKEAYPDPSSWDEKSKYYDPKSSPENVRWIMVDVKFKSKFKKTVTLAQLREELPLADMRVVQRGNRLSITPVTEAEYDHIVSLGS